MKKIVMSAGRSFEIPATWGPPAPALKGAYRFERGAIVEVEDADAAVLLDPKQAAWFGGRSFRPATDIEVSLAASEAAIAASEAAIAAAGVTAEEAVKAMNEATKSLAQAEAKPAGADPLASKAAPAGPDVATRQGEAGVPTGKAPAASPTKPGA